MSKTEKIAMFKRYRIDTIDSLQGPQLLFGCTLRRRINPIRNSQYPRMSQDRLAHNCATLLIVFGHLRFTDCRCHLTGHFRI